MIRTNITIPDQLKGRAQKEAERRGISLSELIRVALISMLGKGSK